MSQSTGPSPYPAPGEIIDGAWRVEKILGEGGMGAVALAWDLFLHTPVAIKFMNPQFAAFPGAEQRFLNEGRASALIKSDHVVPVTKAGKTAGGTPFLVMEALEGHDLAEVIARDGASGLSVERTVHLVMQVLRALQAAHAIGIIHRDLKPSNCFVVTKDGEPDFVKILDFGISKVQQPGSQSLTQTNSALGTPLYMSPEQARSPRDVDTRSDLYSVGVILYELLTGRTPFSSESGELTEILFKLFTADAPPVQSLRPDLPDELAAVVHKALAREVDERFATAAEMAEALAPWANASSLAMLARIRGFKAPVRGVSSIAPPADLPESLLAFSQLSGAGAVGATAVMPNPPATEVMKGPPVTELLAGARVHTQQLSASPQAVEARARPEEATSRTQLDRGPLAPSVAPARTPPPGVSTDLGAARDAAPGDGTTAKRSPLVYALPLLALLGIGIGAAALRGPSGRAAAADQGPSAPADSA
ncbi:MAG: Serine/threonine protein kinase PrkC, regulator of stationary phase, partial [Labilithrix sp.]|nr:Serine/threonine protein kinase PrkC, regulator of stationary phase [Labilithrix sp.]